MHVVLVGGGHAHALLIKRSKTSQWPDGLTLISESAKTPYSGMMTGYLAGDFKLEETEINLKRLCERKGVRFIEGRVTGLDVEKRVVQLSSGEEVSFGVLSLNVGGAPDLSSLPGAEEWGTPVKPLAAFRDAVQKRIIESPLPEPRLVQIGGGEAGCEIVAAIAGRLKKEGRKLLATVVESSERLLPNAPLEYGRQWQDFLMREYGVRILLLQRIERVSRDGIWLRTGERVPAQLISIATPVRPAPWIQNVAVEKTQQGFVKVDSSLQTSAPGIFASGDVAQNPAAPTPRAGVIVVRQAKVLGANLKRAAQGRKPRAHYHPQKKALSLMIDGGGRAFGYRGKKIYPHSRLTRWVKDRIDRRFMRQFR